MEITLNRSRLQEVHEVVRHLADRRSSSPLSEKLLVRAEPGCVSIVATNGDVDVFHQAPAPKDQPAGQILVSLARLGELAKGKEGPVQLPGEEASQADVEKYPVLGTGAPKRFHPADWPAVRDHLRNASAAAAAAQDRYSLSYLCLTRTGIVSTDGHQLYAGNSVSLPVRKGQECLIAPPKVFGAKTLAGFEKVGLAQDDQGIVFRFGEGWIVRLHRQEGTFPNWQTVVPKLEDAKATLTIPEGAAATLPERLRLLLEGTNAETRLSLTLGPKILLAAMDEKGKEIRSLELLDLTRSGEEMTVLFDPKYFLRSLKLGFLALHFFAPAKPILATKGSDLYLWMPCVEEGVALATAGQTSSSEKEKAPKPKGKTESEKPEPPATDLDTILADLDALRDGLRDLSAKVADVKHLIRQRAADLQKRENAVQQALAGLKQLKNLGA